MIFRIFFLFRINIMFYFDASRVLYKIKKKTQIKIFQISFQNVFSLQEFPKNLRTFYSLAKIEMIKNRFNNHFGNNF